MATTDVFVDGISLDFEDAGDSTLSDLVRAVEKEIKGIRRFVDLLSIDGRSVDGWRAGEVMGRAIRSCAEVRLQTSSFDEVAAAGLETLRGYAEVIRESIPQCADALRSGAGAGGSLPAIAEGVSEVIRTVEALRTGGAVYGMEPFQADPAGCCASMVRALESLGEAGRAKDSVTMADILDYELAPLIKELEDALGTHEARFFP